ncbi:MAG: hypothetical protein LBV34_28195, partial [Nocardiopsaceae bacterium]|nr:hypothetical protein [Nocardiopsaceae bacterium]
MRCYKYRALVTLMPSASGGPQAALPGPVCHAVIRAHHRETRDSKIFSALITTSDDDPPPGDSHIVATMVVLGDD